MNPWEQYGITLQVNNKKTQNQIKITRQNYEGGSIRFLPHCARAPQLQEILTILQYIFVDGIVEISPDSDLRFCFGGLWKRTCPQILKKIKIEQNWSVVQFMFSGEISHIKIKESLHAKYCGSFLLAAAVKNGFNKLQLASFRILMPQS